jgi:phage terminase small subunit
MMTDKLTPKQERFVQAYIETGNATEAYRQAYDAKYMKDSTISVKASELLGNGKITVRLEALNEYHQERHDITVDTLTKKHIALYNEHRSSSPSAAVSALKEVAQLHGLHEKRVRHSGEIGNKGCSEDAKNALRQFLQSKAG